MTSTRPPLLHSSRSTKHLSFLSETSLRPTVHGHQAETDASVLEDKVGTSAKIDLKGSLSRDRFFPFRFLDLRKRFGSADSRVFRSGWGHYAPYRFLETDDGQHFYQAKPPSSTPKTMTEWSSLHTRRPSYGREEDGSGIPFRFLDFKKENYFLIGSLLLLCLCFRVFLKLWTTSWRCRT